MSYTVIPLKELRQDAVLPVAIFDGQNTDLMLLNRGKILTGENLQTLQRRGVSHVAIDSRYVSSIWAVPQSGKTNLQSHQHFLAEQRKKNELKNQALSGRLTKSQTPGYDRELAESISRKKIEHEDSLEDFIETIATSKAVRGDTVKSVALESIEHLLADVDLFVKTTIEGGQKEFVHQHCLRVAKLAMSMATILDFREEDVKHIGIGCLLSRVGIDETIREVMNSARELTPLEILEVKKHPGRTWNALERITDLPVGARQVAWQINERWNGTGYPRGRSQKQIHPLARVAGVADVFIALTSPRPHRPAFKPHEAIKQILADTQRGLFEPFSVRGLLKTVSLFPLGSCVELSNGIIGITTRNDPESYDRPTIRVVCSLDGRFLPEQYINLSESSDLEIVQAHDLNHLNQLMRRAAMQTQIEEFQEEMDDRNQETFPALRRHTADDSLLKSLSCLRESNSF